jgi:glycosyltransferase involved in cell wall biosynthesis
MEKLDAPKVSIITPSYNQGFYIEDAIQSVLQQKYSNFEHIIIDNCSSDNTITVLKKYTHLKWISSPDQGQSEALNKGFMIAKGEIIGWLNADDYFLPGAFATIADYFKQNSSFEAFYGSCYFVDAKGQYIKEMKSIPFFLPIAVYRSCYPSSGAFFRSSIFRERKVYLNIDLHYMMAREFYAKLKKGGAKIKAIPEFLSCFRLHGANKSCLSYLEPCRKRHEFKILASNYGIITVKNELFNDVVQRFLYYYFKGVRLAIYLLRADYISRVKHHFYPPCLTPNQLFIK